MHGAVGGHADQAGVVVVDYFTHSGKGAFTEGSYTVDYASIPSFTSPQYGSTYNLRDVVDFRPRRTDGIGQTGLPGQPYLVTMTQNVPVGWNNVTVYIKPNGVLDTTYTNQIDEIRLYVDYIYHRHKEHMNLLMLSK